MRRPTVGLSWLQLLDERPRESRFSLKNSFRNAVIFRGFVFRLWLCENQLAGSRRAFLESRFAIAEVVIPHEDESLWESLKPYFVDATVEPVSPLGESAGVVRSDVFHVRQSHVGLRGDDI